MAKRVNTKKGLRGLFFMVLVMVMVSFVASCDNEEFTKASDVQTFTETVKKDEPVVTPTEDWYLLRDSVNNGHEYSFTITGGERTSGATAISRGIASMEENDRYTIEERYRNLDLAYANSHKSLGKPETNMSKGSLNVTTLCTFGLEDGNIVKVNSNISHALAKVEGVERFFPCDSLTDVRLISVSNVEKAATTRAAYISDSVYTEIKAELTYVTTGLKNNYTYSQVIADTITRYILSEDDVDSTWVENKNRKVLTATNEQCSFDKVVRMKSGEIKRLAKNIILNYGIQTIPEYEKIVKSFNYTLSKSNGVDPGDSKYNRTEENWKVVRRDDKYSAVFNNPAEDISSDYTLFHEGATYNDGDIEVEFPVLDMQVSEGSTTVTSIVSDDSWYEAARLNNTINVDYQGYAQSASESVVLKKEARRVISEGWDISSAKKTITLWNVYTYIEYVRVFSDDTEERTPYEKNFGWSFGPDSSWDVNAENTDHITAAVNATVNGTSKSAKNGEATYSWNENSHSFISDVNVANGVQYDKWVGTTINDIKVERNGNVYDFGHDDYSLNDNKENIVLAESNDKGEIYNYTHSIIFGFGGVTAEASVPGVIRIAKVEVPTFFGELESMSFIVSNNPEHTDYLYTALAHLKGGRVVPGVWTKSGEIQWFLEDEQAGSSTLNGCAYEHSSGKWVPVRGWDSPDCLQYDTQEGANADNQSYATALQWNWDEGALVSGHPSVTTDRISYTMDNGVVSVMDARHGTSLGSWTYKQ